MKRIWAVQLDTLQVIDDICKRHGIKYCEWYGTVLGAVRHHGLIPWDDDIDVVMLREDYDLLCRLSYGDDYMTPIKCPVHSGMKVQIDILREYFEKQGKTLPEYFDMSFE